MNRPSTQAICNIRTILESCLEPDHPDRLITDAIVSYNSLIGYVHMLENRVSGEEKHPNHGPIPVGGDIDSCLALSEFYNSLEPK
jgi:hypothetical protein